MNALLAWYRGRAARERQVLLAGMTVVPVMLIVFGLLSLEQTVNAAEARVTQKRQDMVWLQTVVPQLVALQQRNGLGRGRTKESLVVIADRLARETGITLSSSEPSGNGGLRVHTDKASFDSLALWLGQLTQRNGVSIENAAIDAAEADGTVNATLVLRGR